MKTPHKHAALIKQFAEDMAIDKELISKWKYRLPKDVYFTNVNYAPQWIEDYEYHREPDTITVNGVKVPKPCCETPKENARYYVADPTSNKLGQYTWRDTDTGFRWLQLGLIHLTKEAAQAHIDAILLTSKKK